MQSLTSQEQQPGGFPIHDTINTQRVPHAGVRYHLSLNRLRGEAVLRIPDYSVADSVIHVTPAGQKPNSMRKP